MKSGKSANADRQRRHRQRQRRGLAVWSVVVHENGLAEALIGAGLVNPDTAGPEDYAAAAARVLADWQAQNSVTRYGAWLARQAKIKP